MNKSFNPKAAIISIGAHIALLLLCLFIGYTLPASPAPTEEMGMEVNLGNSETGLGDVAPQIPGAPSETQDATTPSKSVTPIATHI